MTRLAIVGSREFPDEQQVRAFVHVLRADTIVVSGGARGVDRWAEDQARKDGLQVEVFLPDYKTEPKWLAPKLRNTEIAKSADQMVAFWDGTSTGTRDAINKMLDLGKPVNVIVKRK